MEDSSEFRDWEGLIPDALGLVFRKLPLQEILTVVPRVCKTWGRVVSGPYCWQEIDIEEWSQRCKSDQLDRLVRMLVTRSNGSFCKFAASGIPDYLFAFIAEHASSLETLILPRSRITDSIIETYSSRLTNLKYLDISYCTSLGPQALQSLGTHCSSLTSLRRTMHPLELNKNTTNHDEETFTIASSMPNLRHLEIGYLLVTTNGVKKILSSCKNLEFLDIRGCWEVKLDEKLVENVKVLGPHVVDSYEESFWDECSDDSDSSIYSWESMEDEDDVDGEIWEDEQMVEGLEVRFYGDGFTRAFSGFHWPA